MVIRGARQPHFAFADSRGGNAEIMDLIFIVYPFNPLHPLTCFLCALSGLHGGDTTEL